MPSQNDDSQRPARQRANTSAFTFGAWRRGRVENVPTPAPPAVSSPLQWEALIEALTPPAVPSLSYAKSLASALGTIGAHSPPPSLSTLQPVLATLCSPDSPPPLQTAGYDILTAFLIGNKSSMSSTADRLSCLSLFVDAPWSQELWEARSKALGALINSESQTMGMETQILRMLASWIERAFDDLALTYTTSHEDKLERQRSVESLTGLLINLIKKDEFVSRLTEDDTVGVLRFWERLLDRALSMAPDFTFSPHGSPEIEPQSSKTATPPKLPLAHRRHHSATSSLRLSPVKHPAEILVDAYLTYLSVRLVAIGPTYLTSILPFLFRALNFYTSVLPRISIQPSTTYPHQHTLEQRVSDFLSKLVAGPYASQCKILLKRHFFPSSQTDTRASVQTSAGAIRTLRLSVRRVLEGRLARGYIARASSVEYSPAGVPTHLALERGLLERAWAKDEGAEWDLVRFANVLVRAARSWIAQDLEVNPLEINLTKETVLHEIAGIVKDVMQAIDQRGEGEEVDDEEIEAVGRVMREVVVYVRSLKYVHLTAFSFNGKPVDWPPKDARRRPCAHFAQPYGEHPV